MKNFFDIGIRRTTSRVGFGVAFTGYLAANQDQQQAGSTCSANASSRAVGQSSVAALNVCRQNLKDELVTQHNEQVLANIMHGNKASATSLFENNVRNPNSPDAEKCHSPEIKVLTWENTRSSNSNCSTDNNLQTDQDDEEQDSSKTNDMMLVQSSSGRQSRFENRFLEYHSLHDNKPTEEELEQKLIKINETEVNLSPSRTHLVTNGDRKVSISMDKLKLFWNEAINVTRTLRINLPHTRTKVAAIEHSTNMQNSGDQITVENDSDDRNKLKKMKLLKYDKNQEVQSSSHMKQDSNMMMGTDSMPILITSISTIEVQEGSDVAVSNNVRAEEDELIQGSNELGNDTPSSELRNNISLQDKISECDIIKTVDPNKKEKTRGWKSVKGIFNRFQKGRSSTKNFDSDKDSSLHSSASANSTANSGNMRDEKHKNSRGPKLSSLTKHFSGKRSYKKVLPSSNNSVSSSKSSERAEVVSAQFSDSSINRKSYMSFPSKVSTTTTKTDDQLNRENAMDDYWKSPSAWLHDAYRNSLGISTTQHKNSRLLQIK